MDIQTAPKILLGQYCLIGRFLDTDAVLYDNQNASLITVNNPGKNLFNVDARLAPLANNGGRTQTHALKIGSPAINQGGPDSFNVLTDQRGVGFKRKVGAAFDIGAFERQ